MKFNIKINNEYKLTQITPDILKKHNIRIGEKTVIEQSVKIDNNVFIGNNVLIKGTVEINENVEIGHFSIIKNTKLEKGVKIGHHCLIEGSLIKENSQLDNSILVKSNTEIKGTLKFNKTLEEGIFINLKKLNIFYTGGDEVTINCEKYKIRDIVKDVEKFARDRKFSVEKAKQAMKYLKLIQEFDK